jgi:hypothetical protein
MQGILSNGASLSGLPLLIINPEFAVAICCGLLRLATTPTANSGLKGKKSICILPENGILNVVRHCEVSEIIYVGKDSFYWA